MAHFLISASDMEIRFDGKTALVTGATRGIGYACAEQLLKSGANVVVLGTNQQGVYAAQEKLKTRGTVGGVRLDLAQVDNISGTVKQIRQKFGEIDILVQAAGLLRANQGERITVDEWDDVSNVNSRGLFFMMQAVCKQSMIPRRSGAIVNISSIAGIRGMAEPLCSAHYSASKGAVIQITRQAAVEWAKYNIRANVVAPGGVKTEGLKDLPPDFLAAAVEPIPLKKLSEPEDIANAVCFLASDAAGMITGHVMVVDGGGSVVGK